MTWFDEVKSSGGESLDHINHLSSDSSLINGNLLCAAKLIDETTNQMNVAVMYDGWHR